MKQLPILKMPWMFVPEAFGCMAHNFVIVRSYEDFFYEKINNNRSKSKN